MKPVFSVNSWDYQPFKSPTKHVPRNRSGRIAVNASIIVVVAVAAVVVVVSVRDELMESFCAVPTNRNSLRSRKYTANNLGGHESRSTEMPKLTAQPTAHLWATDDWGPEKPQPYQWKTRKCNQRTNSSSFWSRLRGRRQVVGGLQAVADVGREFENLWLSI